MKAPSSMICASLQFFFNTRRTLCLPDWRRGTCRNGSAPQAMIPLSRRAGIRRGPVPQTKKPRGCQTHRGFLAGMKRLTLRRLGAELVADAAFELIFGKMTADGRGWEKCHRGSVDESAEIGIAIFRQQRPVVGDGVVYTAAGSPAIARMRKAREAAAKSRRVVSVGDTGDRPAASGVEQRAIDGDAHPSAN